MATVPRVERAARTSRVAKASAVAATASPRNGTKENTMPVSARRSARRLATRVTREQRVRHLEVGVDRLHAETLGEGSLSYRDVPLPGLEDFDHPMGEGSDNDRAEPADNKDEAVR